MSTARRTMCQSSLVVNLSDSACLPFLATGDMSRNGADEDDGVGYEQQDHAAVFDLAMDYSDDEVLLDWEKYSGAALACLESSGHGYSHFCVPVFPISLHKCGPGHMPWPGMCVTRLPALGALL